MPEEQLFKIQDVHIRSETAQTLAAAAEQIEFGTVELTSATQGRSVSTPGDPRLEVELERLTDSETGEQRYELSWTE